MELYKKTIIVGYSGHSYEVLEALTLLGKKASYYSEKKIVKNNVVKKFEKLFDDTIYDTKKDKLMPYVFYTQGEMNYPDTVDPELDFQEFIKKCSCRKSKRI